MSDVRDIEIQTVHTIGTSRTAVDIWSHRTSVRGFSVESSLDKLGSIQDYSGSSVSTRS